MRLLDARNLELVDVRDDDVPPYAILSHTWEDDEVTLQEVRRMRGKLPQALNKQKQQIAEKKGFIKIKRAAAKAVHRGFNFIWIDTCCIDKTSSSELSEAINSMYRWYRQAAECYALLSDVGPATEENWLLPDSQLRSSRWFTRGWTLQELIAPPNVYFFARNWSILGQKDQPEAFAEVISEVTGIELEVLDGRIDPAQLSVATRMKWAASRQTTRLEDSAYCLMGLFQVNMPLLYGEGHRAFTRLQEEIIQRSDDQSLFAWIADPLSPEHRDSPANPDELCGLLAKSPESFKGVGELQPLPLLPVYTSTPSTMTNLGLRVQLYLRPMQENEGVPMEEDFYAILDCIVRADDQYLCPAIPLRRLSEDQYARLKATPLKFLAAPESELHLELEGYRTIYVRQDPIYYHLPQIRVASIHSVPRNTGASKNPALSISSARSSSSDGTSSQYTLIDTFPPGQWNSHTLTMAAKYSRELQAMALFRFGDRTRPTISVDVVVGLRRLDAMRWEGWCFQLSKKGTPPPLASVMETVNLRIKGLLENKVQGAVSSAALRDALGDDCRVLTDATVMGVQLQGRWYVSVSVSLKLEMTQEGVDRTSAVFVAAQRKKSLDSDPGSTGQRPPFLFRNPPATARILTERPWMQDAKATPFHEAVNLFLDSPEIIEKLLRHQPHSANRTDHLGRSPLWWAAATRQVVVLGILLESGALVNLADDMGLTPLHVACRSGSVATVTRLLGSGADPTVRTHKLDLTPLDLAAMFGYPEVVAMLVGELKRTPLSQDFFNRALHIAASCGRIPILQLLLRAGADPFVSYDYFFTMDKEKGFANVVEKAGNAIFAIAQTGNMKIAQHLAQESNQDHKGKQPQGTQRPFPGKLDTYQPFEPAMATSRGSQASANMHSSQMSLSRQSHGSTPYPNPPTRVSTNNASYGLPSRAPTNTSIIAQDTGFGYGYLPSNYPFGLPQAQEIDSDPYRPGVEAPPPLQFVLEDVGANKYRRYLRGGFEYADSPLSPTEGGRKDEETPGVERC
ncbi:hypothetical protein OQA88_872 [Cercophora sp. LCS_1]